MNNYEADLIERINLAKPEEGLAILRDVYVAIFKNSITEGYKLPIVRLISQTCTTHLRNIMQVIRKNASTFSLEDNLSEITDIVEFLFIFSEIVENEDAERFGYDLNESDLITNLEFSLKEKEYLQDPRVLDELQRRSIQYGYADL